MGVIWILLGALIIAAAFFVQAFAQVLSIESRLRHLVVETEERLVRVYKIRMIPPGWKPPEEEQEMASEATEVRE